MAPVFDTKRDAQPHAGVAKSLMREQCDSTMKPRLGTGTGKTSFVTSGTRRDGISPALSVSADGGYPPAVAPPCTP